MRQNINFLVSLADAHGCKIIANSNAVLAIPWYDNQRQTTYSCAPQDSSTQYEVHVLAVYEVTNRFPPKTGSVTVNIISQGNSDRPIVLVLGNYEPVNWILNLPAGITISEVILVSIQKTKTTKILYPKTKLLSKLPIVYFDN